MRRTLDFSAKEFFTRYAWWPTMVCLMGMIINCANYFRKMKGWDLPQGNFLVDQLFYIVALAMLCTPLIAISIGGFFMHARKHKLFIDIPNKHLVFQKYINNDDFIFLGECEHYQIYNVRNISRVEECPGHYIVQGLIKMTEIKNGEICEVQKLNEIKIPIVFANMEKLYRFTKRSKKR